MHTPHHALSRYSGAIEPQFYAELLQILSKNLPSDLVKQLPHVKKQHDKASWPSTRATFESAFLQKSRQEWTDIFGGTDACVAPILTPGEAAVQAVEPRMPADLVADGLPVVPQPAPHLSRTPARMPAGSAAFTPREEDPGAEILLTPGEHTNEVLTGWAGMGQEELLELWKANAVGGPDPPEVRSKL